MEQHKKHTLFLADSRNLGSFLQKESADLVLTGPPYGDAIPYSADPGQLSAMNGSDFMSALADVWNGCNSVLKPGGILAVWVHDFFAGTDGRYRPFHAELLSTFAPHFELKNIVTWNRYLNRDKGKIPGERPLGTRVQYILLLQKEGTHPVNGKLIEQSLAAYYWNPVWNKKAGPRLLGFEGLFRAAHWAAKKLPFMDPVRKLANASGAISDRHAFSVYTTECPEEVAERVLVDFSRPGDTVLDPFLGSGTTMKVASRMNRRCIGIEINKSAIPAVLSKVGTDNVTIMERS